MRGKPGYGVFDGSDKRNIPAYAGKTRPKVNDCPLWEEHPRVCGENRNQFRGAIGPVGTSPRMRGKRIDLLSRGVEQRNIPAYAGKTCWEKYASQLSEEHPRVCGENQLFGGGFS